MFDEETAHSAQEEGEQAAAELISSSSRSWQAQELNCEMTCTSYNNLLIRTFFPCSFQLL